MTLAPCFGMGCDPVGRVGGAQPLEAVIWLPCVHACADLLAAASFLGVWPDSSPSRGTCWGDSPWLSRALGLLQASTWDAVLLSLAVAPASAFSGEVEALSDLACSRHSMCAARSNLTEGCQPRGQRRSDGHLACARAHR